VGCGEPAPKGLLVRFVLRGGAVEPDPAGVLPGRGAYLHRNGACAREAIRRRGFDRSFRAQVRTPGDTVLESLTDG
jgi:predicted RNA-binding protein YlxR (DUF448 family)